MKHKIERTNPSTKRFSTRTIAMVLSIVMLIGSIATGSMLSTFAAYLKDAAKADAVTLAASEGGNIALNAIPSEDDADNAEETPDLSGLEENEIVRGMKDDLAVTGRDADVASTGQTSYLRDINGKGYDIYFCSDGTSWAADNTSKLTNSGDNNHYSGSFIISGNSNNSINFKIYTSGSDGGWYANGYGFHSTYDGGEMELYPSGGNMSLALGSNSSSKRFTVTVDLYCKYGSNHNSYLKVSFSQYETAQFYGGVTGSWALSDMTYDSKDCYRYDILGNGNRISFRLRWAGSSETIYYYPGSNHTAYDIKNTNNYESGYNMDSSTSSDNTSKYFYFDTVSGGSYTVFIKLGRVWITKSEPASEYYLTGYLNGTNVTTRETANKFSSSGTSWTLTFNSTIDTLYPTVYDNTGVAYHPSSLNAPSGTASTGSSTNGPGNDNKWMVTGAKNKNVTFTWNSSTKKLSWTVTGETVTVYAKDGAAPISWTTKTAGGASSTSGTAYNLAVIATTTANDGAAFTSVNCGDSSSKYQYKNVEKGKTVTVTTTIASGYRTKYYVRGWCINGVTYKTGTNVKGINTSPDTSTGKYTMSYTIPAKTTETKFEITPIYYLVNNSNCLTFYLENFESVKSTWGNTPYAYPFYGDIDGYRNSFGVYPGQPFVYVDGKYSIEIPLASVGIADSTKDGTKIKGVTVHNGYADHVHKNLIYNWTTATGDTGNDKDHMQTYDFDDFYKIYNEKRDSQGNKPNAIFMRLKRETTTYNRNTYGSANNGINWGFSKNDPNSTLSSTNVNTIASSGNGWELLTDRYGRPVDIFGNVIGTSYSSAAEQAKPAMRVISTGYNENIAGDYGTGWLIYTPNAGSGYNIQTTNAGGTTGDAGYRGGSYTLQTASTDRKAVPPSVFLLNSESSFSNTTYPGANRGNYDGVSYTDSITNYKSLYTTLKTSTNANINAVGRYVYISYEKDAQRIGKTNSSSDTNSYGAYRLDARWYYTFATDMVRSKVKIQVWNTATGKYEDVSFKTNNSGYNNKNNNAVASTVSGKSTENLKAYFTNANFDGDVDSGEVLINSGNFELKATTVSGWKFEEWAIEQDGVYTHMNDSAVASTSMSASDTYVARFYPVEQGDLVITHDVAGTGSAKTEIGVKVYTDSTKTSLVEDLGTEEDIFTITDYISNDTKSLYIDVTLKTTPTGDDAFNSFGYDSFNTSKSITATEDKTATPKTSNFGFTVEKLYSGNSQITHSLAYTSSLTAATYNYKITYQYPKRGSNSNNGSYTVSGTFTSNQYKQYVVDASVAVANRKLTDSCITEKAPFESNYLKTLTLNASGATQSCSKSGTTITHTITATFTSANNLDTYAIFDLPYEYYASGDTIPSGSKIYTAKVLGGKVAENHDTLPVEIDTTYGDYFTNGAHPTPIVTKVTDTSDTNHAGNDFITAPEEIWDGSTKKYFMYWEVRNIVDNQLLLQIRYPDFNYRSCGNYHIEPIYSTDEDDSWKVNYSEGGTTTSILYLDSTRNQWNSSTSQNTTNADTAADLIYNDFLLSYYYKGQTIKNNSSITDCGMIIELVPTVKGGNKYALGDASTPGTAGYKTTYAASIPDNSTLVGIAKNGSSTNYIRINKDSSGNSFQSQLNDKNRYQFSYSFYSRYGQNGFDFKTDSSVDNYVYRAYTYVKDSSDNVTISEPTYFSMKYTASR